MPSGGVAVVCATMPLWAGVLGAVVRRAPDARASGLALVLGFVGVVVLIGGPSLAGKPLHILLRDLLADPVGDRLAAVAAHEGHRRRARCARRAGGRRC